MEASVSTNNGFLINTQIINDPSENKSDFSVSKSNPSAIWGELYPCVPIDLELDLLSYLVKKPKSPNFTTSSLPMNTFSGLMSRCDIPCDFR